jgi:hypothetical protein
LRVQGEIDFESFELATMTDSWEFCSGDCHS